MRVSNYTGQMLLGMGVAALAALFYILRDLVRHWRVWHLPAVAICAAALLLVMRHSARPK